MLCTDSMGKEINSSVLIMQRSDTDLILCLSTCIDILMHSVPATISHTGGYFFPHSLFKARFEKKKDWWGYFLFGGGGIIAKNPSGAIIEKSGVLHSIFPPPFKEDCGNAYGRFSETMGMLSVC